ncbi:MAG: hypothetical protein JRD89_01580 [Deltaproteobacteria bacterium]|nr:hypothetical protein [Deltaproteobacteria bacterium]
MEFLEKIKKGDKVVYNYNGPSICKVLRTTKTLVCIELKNHMGSKYESRFRKSDGEGLDSRHAYLTEATDDRKKEISRAGQRGELIRRIRKVRLEAISVEALEAVADILEAAPFTC